MRRFKALCDDVYPFCRDEYHLYKEWVEVTRARPRCISIKDELVTEEDEQEMNGKENFCKKGADEDRSQAFFWRITNKWRIIFGSCFVWRRQSSFGGLR
jgi:hypothetical protein